MGHIITYSFKPIENPKQNLHIISVSERMEKGKDLILVAHRTDFFIVQVITSGRSSHMVDFNEITVEKGDVLFIVPGQIHAFRKGIDYDGWLVAFPKDFFYQSSHDHYFLDNANIFNNLHQITRLNLPGDELDPILALILKISDELKSRHDTFQRQILHNYLSNLLLFSERKFIQDHTDETKSILLTQEGKLVTEFKKQINKYFRNQTTVKYYAGMLLVSERTLQKATMATLGKSPKELINEQIILESKRLLVHELMTVKEIGYFLGFDEPSNFTKFFKKQTGISPSQFKSKN
ncbi:helix-turn-helix transcriptional regulator [Chryseobacterium fluminis]|uniref:helix-turn-helix domain-containing protein n=1 Tax=Chryseobacterium fluminis TaxID=2983606 RepID=UPI00224EDC3C|nr:helix-turn-helix transcriptional regulator [Chryseobacterium sp. MMS21-Ot14]UZT99379.1 helix-turn-helix transcriptional regulator [Chryseobacterium sp. MMS21-Ot14]